MTNVAHTCDNMTDGGTDSGFGTGLRLVRAAPTPTARALHSLAQRMVVPVSSPSPQPHANTAISLARSDTLPPLYTTASRAPHNARCAASHATEERCRRSSGMACRLQLGRGQQLWRRLPLTSAL